MRIRFLCAGAEVIIRSGKYAGRRGEIRRSYLMADRRGAGQYYSVRLHGMRACKTYTANYLETI